MDLQPSRQVARGLDQVTNTILLVRQNGTMPHFTLSFGSSRPHGETVTLLKMICLMERGRLLAYAVDHLFFVCPIAGQLPEKTVHLLQGCFS